MWGYSVLDCIPVVAGIVVIELYMFLYAALADSLYIQFRYIKFTFSMKKELSVS